MMRTLRIALLTGAAALSLGAVAASAAPMNGAAINDTASASALTQRVDWDDWRWHRWHRWHYWHRDYDDGYYHRHWWWHHHHHYY